MGISLYQLDTEFFIPRKFKSDALFSIKKFIENKNKIAFVEISNVERAETLEEALTFLRWNPETNDSGDIIEINFTGEKLGDDYIMFSSIAVFIENGSYITLVGEDGKTTKLWRWLFMNDVVIEKNGRLLFE